MSDVVTDLLGKRVVVRGRNEDTDPGRESPWHDEFAGTVRGICRHDACSMTFLILVDDIRCGQFAGGPPRMGLITVTTAWNLGVFLD